MVRTPCCGETRLKKGTWTAEEDLKLISYVTRYGCWNWRRLPKFAGLSRCGKSCRLRWLNYLRPNIKRGNFSKEEEDIIIQMHGANGNKWSMIAAKLDGRTDNEVKNHWHTNLKKRLKQNMKAHEAKKKKKHVSQFENTEEDKEREPLNPVDNCSIISTTSVQSPESFVPMSPPQPSSSSELSNMNTNWQVGYDHNDANSSETCGEITSGDFWTEPFVADSFNNVVGNDYNLMALIDPELAFSQCPVSRGALLEHFGFYEEQDCLNWRN